MKTSPRRCCLLLSLAAALLALPAAQAATRVDAQVGADLWSRRVEQVWLPQAREALARFDEFARTRYGQDEGATAAFSVTLASSASGAGEQTSFRLEAGMPSTELQVRARRWPVTEAMLALQQRLAQGQAARLPTWLRYGLAEGMAAQLLDEQPAFEPFSASAVDRLTKMSGVPGGASRRLAQALVKLLQERMGDGFHPAMKQYLQAGAGADFDADKAFAAAFGLTMAEHIEQGKQRLAQVPKTEAPDAVAKPQTVQITVQMSGHVNDEFAREVEREWLPVVRQASEQFNQLVREGMRVRLHKPVRIYLAAGVEDYEQLLVKDMHVRPSAAGLHGEVDGGLSNGAGQIALKIMPGINRMFLHQWLVKAVLHELTHELQKQVGYGFYGFHPPRWLNEGGADLIAYQLLEQQKFDGVSNNAASNWRRANLNWYRNANKTQLKPEDLLDLDLREWQQMMKERRGNYQMAGLMTSYLQAIMGEDFLRAWVRYYLKAGMEGERAKAAFEQSFGMSEKEFVADFKRWLAQQ